MTVAPEASEAQAPVRDRLIASLPFLYGWVIYGWVIVFAGAIGSFMTLPGQTNGVAMFFDPLAADLGLTRAQIALPTRSGRCAASSRHHSWGAGSIGGGHVWPRGRSPLSWDSPASSWL